MYKIKFIGIAIIFMLSLVLTSQSVDVSARAPGATSPTLGAAASYSVLAGSIVTNTGPTTMPGNLGISPSIGVAPHYTNFPPGVVGPPGVIHDADAHAAAAQAANTAAFGFIDQGCDVDYGAGLHELGGSSLGPGTYCAGSFAVTGNLTLAGTGVWIFKSASTLTGAANSSVTGGDPCNVWWRVASSATLNPGAAFIGYILALTSIDMQTNASLNGVAMAQTGAVTLDSNTITGVLCLIPETTPRRRNVAGLPDSGGAPIRNQDLPWSLLVIGGICAIALVFGVRQYRFTKRSK